MRLLLLTQDFPPDTGGIQTYSAELAWHFSGLCDWFGVMAPTRPNADAVDADLPFPVYRIASSYDMFPARTILPLWQLARDEQIDTVLHAQWQTLVSSLCTRALTGRPRRIFCAAHGRELLLNPLGGVPVLRDTFEHLRAGVLRRTDGFFPVSRFTARLLHGRGVPRGATHVVSNGTDPQRFRPVDDTDVRSSLSLDDRPTLLTVGRLVPRKGIDTVLRALPRLRTAVPDITYVIVGDGPDRSRLETLARDLGVDDHTRFAGRVPHERLIEYYSASDVFILTARSAPPSVEGFGIVFLESNACERPVIGSRSGGIPDAVLDGETGFLVEPDDVDELVDRTTYLLKNPEAAREMGKRGRERILESLTWKHVAERLYESMTVPPESR